MQALREERTDNHWFLNDSLLAQPVNGNFLTSSKSIINVGTRLTDLVLSSLGHILMEDTKSFVILPLSSHVKLSNAT